MQKPIIVQVLRPALLREGFDFVRARGLEVTDDVSIVEHLGRPVKITEGDYTNLKARGASLHADLLRSGQLF